MAVLVTGGAGYIGSHVVLELLEAGETIVVLDDLSSGFRSAVPGGASFVQGDIGDRKLLARVLREYEVDAVLHFAAKTIVPESVADPLTYYENNSAKALALIQSVVDAGVRHFVFSSTAAVYGETRINPVPETAPLDPTSPYGRSKLMVEWILRDVSRAHSLAYVALRYFNVAGADPQGRAGQSTSRATHLIKVAVQAALGMREGIDVFGVDYATPDGSCLRDYIQVTDLARAHLDALRYLRGGGESVTCNCGYGHGHSVLEVIDMVKQVSGRDFPVRIVGRRPGDMAAVVAENALIRRVLDWNPRHDDLRTIVKQALDWERRVMNNDAPSAKVASPNVEAMI